MSRLMSGYEIIGIVFMIMLILWAFLDDDTDEK